MADFPAEKPQQTLCDRKEKIVAKGRITTFASRESQEMQVTCARWLRKDGTCPKHGRNTT